VHIPSGITVSCQIERSQLQNKATAMRVLQSRLLAKQRAEQDAAKQKLRGNVKSAAWGEQIRSYVLHPYQMVKDHRTDVETSDTTGVLDGDLDQFVLSWLQIGIHAKNQ
jgi:peptide chain release factor 2